MIIRRALATALLATTLAGAPAVGLAQEGASASMATLWREGDPGERLLLHGRVLGVDGGAVAGATVEIWHADAEGVVHADRYRAALVTGEDGEFVVSTVLPGYIWGPRHIHFVVSHPEWRQLITRLFFRRDPAVDEVGRPDLAIILEDGDIGGVRGLFGEAQLVLRPR